MNNVVNFKKEKKKRRVKKRRRARLIWSYTAFPRRGRRYYCDDCQMPIEDFFEYTREVWAGEERFWVKRIHHSPPCDFFFDPDEKRNKEEERQSESISNAA